MAKRQRRRTRPVVALLVETSNAFSRALLHGVRDWMAAHRQWTIHLTEQGRGNRPPHWLKDWQGDGIISRIETPEIARAVTRCGVPVVNVSATGLAPHFPAVISDSAAIARLAARHLMERGFRNLAYCGDGRFVWSNHHGRNFVEACREEGLNCEVFPTHGDDQEQPRIRKWLSTLPRPVGIMACYDVRAQQVLDACRTLDLRVPEDVAVIGQHNDELLCELCDPPLSSVIPNAHEAGRLAAAKLDHAMSGGEIEASVTAVPPIGIATRQSTDTIAVADRRLAMAVEFIRGNAFDPITVADVCRSSGLSRTLLERLYRRHFGMSPYEQVLRLRIAKAKDLLVTSKLSVAEIGQRVGFATPEHFSAIFKRRVGKSPVALRR